MSHLHENFGDSGRFKKQKLVKIVQHHFSSCILDVDV